MAISLHMVPDGRNKAASLPSNSATRLSSREVVGSVPNCSSPTSASRTVARIPAVGLVWVSEWKLCITASIDGCWERPAAGRPLT